jgi:FkbM family methyltransferase
MSRTHISSSLALFGIINGNNNGKTFPLLAPTPMHGTLRHLPVVDVGTNTGKDFAIPAAKAGHRVYAFEPNIEMHQILIQKLQMAGVHSTQNRIGFRHAAAGTVLALHAAVSNSTGQATFYSGSTPADSVASALHAAAVPRRVATRAVTVPLVTLDTILAQEERGLFILKIDSQGNEVHVLRGAAGYIRTHPVRYILVEYFPKGLVAAGVEPLSLLTLLQHELGFQCFDVGQHAHNGSQTLEEFVQRHNVRHHACRHPTCKSRKSMYGPWTDLLCVDFTVM